MKIYKKIMNALAAVEKIVLVISTLLILVLTVGNVFSRKVIHRSWSFTEELVVAVFVLITLLAAALACREGELVSLTLVTRPPSKETEETIRNSDHSPEHHLQRHPFQIRNGQGNYSASEWKKNLRIKLA